MSAADEQKLEKKVAVADAMKDSSQIVLAMQQEPVDSLVSNQNGTNGSDGDPLYVPKPVKTEGEASATENSFIPRTLPHTPSVPSQSNPPPPSPVTPFAPNIGNLSAHLTADEQAVIYKKANILALSALAKKGGPNTKDMFAVQQKLQEFLTSLITLAGQKGPQLKVTVQMLVQNLVTGQISEDEFATKIESDLRSQHQPSLLPFLKSSVPHLKTRLQLQQAIMKELIQRSIAEKKVRSTASTTLGTSTITTCTTSSTTDSLPSSSQTSSSSSLPVGVSTAPGSLATTSTLVTVTQGPGLSKNTAKPVISGTSISIGNTAAPITSLGTIRASMSLDNMSLQFPKILNEQISKLPPDQKLLYIQQILKTQHLKQQQQQKTVREKQMKLVQEQQGVVGMARLASAVGVAKSASMGMVKTVSVGVVNSASGGVMRPEDVVTSSEMEGKGKVSVVSLKAGPSGIMVSPLLSSSAQGGKKKGKGKDTTLDAEEEEEVGMDILDEVGVNLQEETAQFLPKTVGDVTVARSCKDVVLLNMSKLRQKVEDIMRVNGVQEVSEDVLVCISHATQERLRDVLEKLTEISRHRIEVLKDDNHYRVQSEVRNQLRILETIDRTISKRKLERDNEQTLRAAKSRSKGADPERAAKIREEAKQIQQDEAARLRNESANRTALAAIGRKRPLPPSASEPEGGVVSPAGPLEGVASSNTFVNSSLFAPLASTRAPKRHVTSRDLIFYLEQERETRKTLTLYQTFLK